MKKEHYHNTKLSEKEHPFKTPEGYFETFHERMMGRLALEAEVQHPPTARVMVLRYLRPALALAASFAIIFMLVYYPVKSLSPSLTKNTMNELEHDLLNYYFTDDVFIGLFTEDNSVDDYDETSIETVLLASMSDYDLLHIKNE
ncbi:MAG: hypothetical protein JXR22_05600 [Prolixibacteraceae bacterium]|nr:hypothetical protein [Prolixibacteraceae bacterium]